MRQRVTRYFDQSSKVIIHWYEVAREGKAYKQRGKNRREEKE